MRPDIFLATIGRGSNGSNALEVTEDRAAVTAESQDNIINRVNNVSQYGPSWHYVPGIGVAGTAYAEVPGTALGDLAFSRASSKTRTNAAGVVETIGNNIPPHDYRNADGTLSTFPRLNLEPQRTNSIRNSSMVGAVAGTPGTLPTNWAVTTSGLTQTIVGVGMENGLPYIDVRLNGTASGTAAQISSEGVSQIVAAQGQVWANSIYAKVISAPNPPLSYNISYREGDAGGVLLVTGAVPFTPTSVLTRFSATRTLTDAATTRIQPRIQFNLTNGAAYDFTIRIAAPQMELGAYATTWVPTTTAAVTRIFDLASKTGVSSLIGQTEGTLFLDFESGANDGVNNTFSINNGSVNRIIIRKTSSNTIDTQVRVAAVTQALIATSAITVNTRYKCAVGYKENDIVFYVNGVQIGVDTSSTIPACSIISNDAGSSIEPMYRPINQAALFPTRLTNAQLAQLTTL
jgi:hypothetical protein